MRAALEAIAHQVADVLEVLPTSSDTLRVDGGAAANAFLMQHQADLIGRPVQVAGTVEATALGAAALAGLAVGVWQRPEDVVALLPSGPIYEPRLSDAEAAAHRAGWRDALARCDR